MIQKILFNFCIAFHVKLHIEKLSAALHHILDCVVGTVEPHLQIFNVQIFNVNKC